MFYTQTKFTTIPKKTIHLDLYVDESKNRTYTRYDGKTGTITYIMILAVPKDKKADLYQKLNNARCLSEEEHIFEKCNNNCRFHYENDGELHYTEIQKKNNVKYKIANKWLDILLDNNLNDDKSIFFNILGIIESNLDISKFGDEKQFGNIYCRFFRTCLLRLIAMFKKYDQVIIDNIFHDETTEMELHPYFNTNAIKQITGMMVFGEYPQGYLPQLFIACVVVPGRKLGDVGELGQRFDDNERVEGTIEEMLDKALAFVRRNIGTMVIIDDNGQRTDVPHYPMKALREAIANALIHRLSEASDKLCYAK